MDWLSVQYFIGQKRHLESTQLQSNGLKSEKNNNLGNPHILIVSSSTKGISTRIKVFWNIFEQSPLYYYLLYETKIDRRRKGSVCVFVECFVRWSMLQLFFSPHVIVNKHDTEWEKMISVIIIGLVWPWSSALIMYLWASS